MERPALNKALNSAAFRDFYYLKEELVRFCRENGLSTAGGKLDLTERIARYLDTGEAADGPSSRKKAPDIGRIEENARIEENFVCSQKHRAFFKEHIGKGFSFNVAFQNWLKSNAGKTYKDAIKAYYKLAEAKKNSKTEISRQFEYNSLSLNMEYDRFDVLSCVKNAIEPKVKMQFSVPGYKYPENGGFPTTAIPSLQWAVPEIIMMDNARSHLSSDVVSQLTSYLRCTVNFGPVSTPVSRGIIERTFGILEESGYHRIPSTTGSSQMDPRSKSAESDAIKYSISYEMIKETTELLIAQYNNTARDVLGNRSPLEVLESRIQCGMSPNYVQAQQREEFSLLSYTETRVVRG